MAKDTKVKTYKELKNANKEMFHGLMELGNSPHYKHMGTLIRLIKQNVLFDEFSYPATDPVKNALNKEYYKGMDMGLTIIAQAIKNAGHYADLLEEDHG